MPEEAHVSPRLSSRLLVSVFLLLALIVAGGAYGLWTQNAQLDDLGADVASMRKTADSRASVESSAQQKSQQQVAGLANQLAATQTRLAEDEKQLRITQSKLPPDVTALADKVSSSVVRIACATSAGTGFAIQLTPDEGYGSMIMTAAHVIAECAQDETLISVNREGQSFSAAIFGIDEPNDVALLQVKPKITALKPSSSAPSPGDFVMAVGNPLGINNVVSQGNVSKVLDDTFTHTAAVSSGSSGGPLVNRDGAVVGVVLSVFIGTDATDLSQNLNNAGRLKLLCQTILNGSPCKALN